MAAALILLARALILLPQRCLEMLASGLARFACVVSRRDVALIQSNIRRVYGLPAHSEFASMFARQVFRSQLICAVDSLREILRPGSLKIDGTAELKTLVRKAEASGKGYILLGAHLGAWELCALTTKRAGELPLSVLAKPSRWAPLTHFLEIVRGKMTVKVLWTDRKSILREMLAGVKAGGGVGFVADQKPEGRLGPVVQFLGQPTEFVSGPAMLASRTNCAIIGIAVVRSAPGHYRILASEVLPGGHNQSDELALTVMCAAELEKAIRIWPEQWAWNYKRWKTIHSPAS